MGVRGGWSEGTGAARKPGMDPLTAVVRHAGAVGCRYLSWIQLQDIILSTAWPEWSLVCDYFNSILTKTLLSSEWSEGSHKDYLSTWGSFLRM